MSLTLIAPWLTPALTTINVDAALQGKIAAELLIKRLRGEPIAERQIKLPTSLVLRDSTGPAAMKNCLDKFW